MTIIVPIVEGHGEREALPVLVRRIAYELDPEAQVDVKKPIRVSRGKLLKAGELERAVELAARQGNPDGAVLVVLDADRDCPASLATTVLERSRVVRGDRRIRAVLAKCEFEAWFLAAIESLAGQRGIAKDVVPPDDPETIRDAKGWISARMTGNHRYREVLDQPALSARMDLDQARRASPSFDKLWRDVASIL